MPPYASAYSPAEERANIWIHGVGAAVALVAGLWMLMLAFSRGANAWQLASGAVFTLSMLALYLASTVYHRATDPKRRQRLKVLDHCAIYLLIAGTYTPFTLIALHGPIGWRLFIATWTLAGIGLVFKLFFTGRFNLVSTLVYIAMGWLVMWEWKTVYATLTPWIFGWLLAGGLFYTVGAVVYLMKKVPYTHAVWHGFVVAGTLCHFVAIWAQVVPRA